MSIEWREHLAATGPPLPGTALWNTAGSLAAADYLRLLCETAEQRDPKSPDLKCLARSGTSVQPAPTSNGSSTAGSPASRTPAASARRARLRRRTTRGGRGPGQTLRVRLRRVVDLWYTHRSSTLSSAQLDSSALRMSRACRSSSPTRSAHISTSCPVKVRYRSRSETWPLLDSTRSHRARHGVNEVVLLDLPVLGGPTRLMWREATLALHRLRTVRVRRELIGTARCSLTTRGSAVGYGAGRVATDASSPTWRVTLVARYPGAFQRDCTVARKPGRSLRYLVLSAI